MIAVGAADPGDVLADQERSSRRAPSPRRAPGSPPARISARGSRPRCSCHRLLGVVPDGENLGAGDRLARANSSAAAISSSTSASAASASAGSSASRARASGSPARPLDFGLVAVGGFVAGVVAEPAVGARPRSGSGRRRRGPADRRADAGDHRPDVVAVELDARHVVALAARFQIAPGDVDRRRGQLDVAVVLADEDERQLPEAGGVERFAERAGSRPRPRRRSRRQTFDPPVDLQPAARRRSRSGCRRRRCRWCRAGRSPGSRRASSRRDRASSRRRGRAARPSSGRRRAPLARQWWWPRWVETITSPCQRPAAADRHRLLADREVQRARGTLPSSELLVDGFLEAAAEPHHAVALLAGPQLSTSVLGGRHVGPRHAFSSDVASRLPPGR